jgi:polyisoprenoid-binding protein YceI
MAINCGIDPTHSEVHFRVKHLMITNFTGSFSIFEASVQTEDEDFKKAKVSFSADINSIDTGNLQIDIFPISPVLSKILNNGYFPNPL